MRILLADDHRMMREALRLLIEQWPGFEVVGETGDGPSTLRALEELRPEVALVDYSMSRMNGIEVIARAAHSWPEIRLVMLSMHNSEVHVAAALAAGASGYVLKEEASEELLRALHAVRRGETYLSPGIPRRVVDELLGRRESQRSVLDGLTPRQRQILQLLAEGLSTREIAAALEVSPKTVETYRLQLMNRLDIRNVAGLTRFAIRAGLITSDR